ncbi:hypothetical protein [Caldimonas brevitalea]|nr:hypothetical protein [Caldimonas brevitalea]
MSDEYQIEIPPSFYALYTDARRRLTVPLNVLRARYDLCEDLAQQLVGHARNQHHGSHGLREDEVLRRCRLGLSTPDAGVSAAEAGWVVRRLAELLDWECPAFDTDPAP